MHCILDTPNFVLILSLMQSWAGAHAWKKQVTTALMQVGSHSAVPGASASICNCKSSEQTGCSRQNACHCSPTLCFAYHTKSAKDCVQQITWMLSAQQAQAKSRKTTGMQLCHCKSSCLDVCRAEGPGSSMRDAQVTDIKSQAVGQTLQNC